MSKSQVKNLYFPPLEALSRCVYRQFVTWMGNCLLFCFAHQRKVFFCFVAQESLSIVLPLTRITTSATCRSHFFFILIKPEVKFKSILCMRTCMHVRKEEIYWYTKNMKFVMSSIKRDPFKQCERKEWNQITQKKLN